MLMAPLSSSSKIRKAAALLILTVAFNGCTSFYGEQPDLSIATTNANPAVASDSPSQSACTVARSASPPTEPQASSTPRKESANDPAQDPRTPQTADACPAPEATSASTEATSEGEKSSKPAFELRGRIQAEAALVNQSNRNSTIIGTIDDAVGFRRARLGAQGNIGDQVQWVSEFDFAGGNVAFKDVYIAVTDLPILREVRVGNFCEPFSLEGATSSNSITFVERSPADVFDPAYHWGVGMFSYTDSERATLQAGIFRSGSNTTGNDISNSNDMQYTARVTALPWYEPGAAGGPRLWHIGGAFSQQHALDNTITYNQGPQSSLLTDSDDPGSPFQPKITITASQQQLYNLQTAIALGALTLQAEWNVADIDQIVGGRIVFDGGYVQASYFLTGEHREYLTKYGCFGPVHVRSPFWRLKANHSCVGGPGAWEVATRFAYTDFVSSNLPPSDGVGSRDAETTVGVNWYLNDNTRVMFNWVHAVPVVPGFGPSFANAFFISSQIFW
jgi:phosphate-selective porin OprO/OprP